MVQILCISEDVTIKQMKILGNSDSNVTTKIIVKTSKHSLF